MTSDVIKCPCCNKEMKISKSPLLDDILYHAECKDCHISITTDISLKQVDWLLYCLYRGQWDFEIKYTNGEINYARIGGGRRPLPAKEN